MSVDRHSYLAVDRRTVSRHDPIKVETLFKTEPSINKTILLSIDVSPSLAIDVDNHVSIDIDPRFIIVLANFYLFSCNLCLQMTDRERRTKKRFDRASSSNAGNGPLSLAEREGRSTP
ncbi:hypothetical protein F2Q69_00006034 [Brassica cretica]|uniref:Uncharacterized protein n=1 Tax=Brassica cretica TaxID=69181 RepID=A0A8S9P389_BRACR|nr:hypothetical protein F2Q69_00006034 [Brassica cretica]